MKTQVITLNGPKNSGKDALSEHLVNTYDDCQVFQFKRQLLEDVCNHYSVTREWWDSVYNNRATKETPLVELDGKSPRQAIIHVSESLIKPEKGLDYYGKVLVQDILESGCKVAIVSDGGVNNNGEWVEALPVVKAFGVDNVHIVQIYRPGCSFEGDSRCYWLLPDVVYSSPHLSVIDLDILVDIVESETAYSKTLESIKTKLIMNTEDLGEFYSMGEATTNSIIKRSRGI